MKNTSIYTIMLGNYKKLICEYNLKLKLFFFFLLLISPFRSLTQIIEQNKRKYQTRIRKLEQKIMDVTLEIGRQHSANQQQLQHDVANLNKYKYKQYTSTSASIQQQPPTNAHFRQHQHQHHHQQQHHDNVPETTL